MKAQPIAVYYSHEQPAIRPTQHNTVNQADVTGNALIGLLVIICPSMLILGVILYRKHRTAVRLQQIQTLEKLWRVRSKKDHYLISCTSIKNRVSCKY